MKVHETSIHRDTIVNHIAFDFKRKGEIIINGFRFFFFFFVIFASRMIAVFHKEHSTSDRDILDLVIALLILVHTIIIWNVVSRRVVFRPLPYISSTVDILCILISAYAARWERGNPTLATITYHAFVLLVFLVIVLTLLRQDPWNTLYTGLLAGTVYLGIVILMGIENLFSRFYYAPDSLFFEISLYFELVKVVIFLVSGVAGFLISRNFESVFNQSILIEYQTKKRRTWYNAAFSRMMVGSFTLHGKKGTITEMSKHAEEILGAYTSQKHDAPSFWDIVDSADFKTKVTDGLDRNGIFAFQEMIIKREDGRKIWIEGYITKGPAKNILEGYIIDSSRKIERHSVVNRLIDDREKLNRRIQIDQPLTDIGMNLSGFLHNIKGQLNQIIQGAETLESLRNNLPEEDLAELRSITGNAEMILELAERQKEIAATRIVVEPADIELDRIVMSAILTLSSNSQDDENVEFETRLDKVVWNGLLSEILPVFYNLIQNAKEAVLENTGMYKKVTVTLKEHGETVLFGVEDNGPGLSYCLSGHCLFESCMQCKYQDFGITSKKTGSGLGIWTVKNFLRKNSGDIIFKSEKNRGTLVEITFRKG